MARKNIIVKIEGDKELEAALNRLDASVRGEHLAEAARKGAEIVREEASRRAPRRTGNLARNIVARATLMTGDRAEISVGPNKDAWYGALVEVGTKHARARPYLRPAIDESKEEVERAVRDELRRRIMGAIG